MPVETNGDRPKPQPHQVGSSILSLFLFLLLFNLFVIPLMRPGPKEVLYSQFLQQLKAGRVSQALIEKDEIRYSLKSVENQDDQSKTSKNTQDNQPVYVTTPIASSQVDLVQ
jgi:cell division protease FtsH